MYDMHAASSRVETQLLSCYQKCVKNLFPFFAKKKKNEQNTLAYNNYTCDRFRYLAVKSLHRYEIVNLEDKKLFCSKVISDILSPFLLPRTDRLGQLNKHLIKF